MTFRNHRAEPCWQVNDASTGMPPEADDGEGWSHYKTEAEATADAAERLAEWAKDYGDDPEETMPELGAAKSFSRPCVKLFCDGCDSEWEDEEYGYTHLDPDDPLPFLLSEHDWEEKDGKHYCPNCQSWDDDGERVYAVSPDQLTIADALAGAE